MAIRAPDGANNQNCNMFESSKVYSQVQAWFWMFYLENDLMNSLI